MRRTARRWFLVCILAFALLGLHWLVFQAHEVVPGVFSRPFGPCDVDYFRDRQALVLACLGVDLIKLWPLPVAHPWFEDPILPPRSIA